MMSGMTDGHFEMEPECTGHGRWMRIMERFSRARATADQSPCFAHFRIRRLRSCPEHISNDALGPTGEVEAGAMLQGLESSLQHLKVKWKIVRKPGSYHRAKMVKSIVGFTGTKRLELDGLWAFHMAFDLIRSAGLSTVSGLLFSTDRPHLLSDVLFRAVLTVCTCWGPAAGSKGGLRLTRVDQWRRY